MGIELPKDLADLAAATGLAWPQADEDKLREQATAWRDAQNELTALAAEADGTASAAAAALTGPSADAARGMWAEFVHPDRGHLTLAAQGAGEAADRLEHAAEQVAAAKVEMVRHLVDAAKNRDAAEVAAAAGHPAALLGLDTVLKGTAANLGALSSDLAAAVGGGGVGGVELLHVNPGARMGDGGGLLSAVTGLPGGVLSTVDDGLSGGGLLQPAHGGGLPVHGVAGLADGAVRGVAGLTDGAVHGVAGAAGEAVHGVAGLTDGAVRGVAGAAGETVRGVAGLADGAVHGVAGAAGETVHGVAGLTDGAVRGVAGAAGETVHGVAGLADGAVHGVAGAAGGTVHGVAGLAEGVVPGVAGAAGEAVHGVAGLADGAVHGVAGLADGAVPGVAGAAGEAVHGAARDAAVGLSGLARDAAVPAAPPGPAADAARLPGFGPAAGLPGSVGEVASGLAGAPDAAALPGDSAFAGGSPDLGTGPIRTGQYGGFLAPGGFDDVPTPPAGIPGGTVASGFAEGAPAPYPSPSLPAGYPPPVDAAPSGQGSASPAFRPPSAMPPLADGGGLSRPPAGLPNVAPGGFAPPVTRDGVAGSSRPPASAGAPSGQPGTTGRRPSTSASPGTPAPFSGNPATPGGAGLRESTPAPGSSAGPGNRATPATPGSTPAPPGGAGSPANPANPASPDTTPTPRPAGPEPHRAATPGWEQRPLPAQPPPAPGPYPPLGAPRQERESIVALFLVAMFPIGHLPVATVRPHRQLPPPPEEVDYAAGLRFPPYDHPRSDLIVPGEAIQNVRNGLRRQSDPSHQAPAGLFDTHDPLGGLSERDWDRRFLAGHRDGIPEYAWPPGELYPEGGADAGEPEVLPEGTLLDRFGPVEGRVFAPAGTLFVKRSLPPSAAGAEYRRYRVLRPVPMWQTASAPWFGQPGGGLRYRAVHSADELVTLGYLALEEGE
ncbi:glycohydrolase toxin TNT-related protein [Amycolatopsis dongchuanensis]|uniref:DUF4237 domain-containing protein n=1 Tax=Amycolatopsis dongchuanensis TaxID=1070866 RepID=A0ABP9QWN2_9PSEU